ncbi:hypothetical protein [Lysinibacillus pakistanensis]|uniref:hypothetical protein n=1 Tax=Lysinibacillus pakistanensis TaxID=759811 RepID=UPI003D26D199
MFGGMVFPLFNAQQCSNFQREAPRDRLTQLSAVRLLFIRVTMPLGILFASSTFLDLIRVKYMRIVGMLIVLLDYFTSLLHFPNQIKIYLQIKNKKQVCSFRIQIDQKLPSDFI